MSIDHEQEERPKAKSNRFVDTDWNHIQVVGDDGQSVKLKDWHEEHAGASGQTRTTRPAVPATYEAFDESQHRRGQPENKGEFTSSATGASGKASGDRPASTGAKKGWLHGPAGSALSKAGQAVMSGAHKMEHGASAWIQAQVKKLPASLQAVVTGAYRCLMATYDAAHAAVSAVAREKGFGKEAVVRVARICTALDLIAGGKGVPAALTAAGLGALAPVAAFVPWASLGYLAYSTVSDPLATLNAARQALKTLRDPLAGMGFSRDGTPILYGAETGGAGVGPEEMAALLEYLSGEGDADWKEALLIAALEDADDEHSASA